MPDGITLDYLAVQASVTFDATGSGKAVLSPGAGQFWLPTVAHVGTATLTGNGANCSLHVGAQKVIDYTTQVDFTFSGVSDSSSIISGMIVSPGESITAYFNNGTPFDTGYLRVIGVSSSAPPTVNIEPGFPGAKFTGNESTVTIAAQPVNVDVVNTPTVTIGSQPINVAETSKQMFANQAPVPFDITIAAGSTAVILAASPGTQRYLHTMRIEPAASAGMNCQLEDTSGTALARFFQQNVGTPTTETLPAYGLVDFKGAPLASGVGLQLHNEVGSSQTFAGFVTYSQ